jgi:hypothetical protein
MLTIVFACSTPAATPTPTATPTAPSAQTPTPTQAAVTWSADGTISPGEYPSSSAYGSYEIYWNSDSTHIYAAIRAKTGGWVSVALKPESRMKNADMVFGYVEDGTVSIFDMYSTGDFGPHPPDTDQGGSDDILEFGGAESGGFTTIEFKRALDTGDSKDNTLTPGTNRILWAYGSGDSISQKHAGRGYGEIELK